MPLLESRGSGSAFAYGLNAFQKFLDPFFKYVSTAIRADGINASNNNTFIESSNSVQTTKNGNASQGTFSPFLNSYSVYYDGSSYTQVAQNTAFQFGTGQFAIEYWVNVPKDVNIQPYWTAMTSVGGVGYNQNGIAIYLMDSGYGTIGAIGVDLNNASGGLRLTDNIDIRGTGWRHIAVTRDASNVVRLFLDGQLRQSGTSTLNIDGTGAYGVVIGISDSGQNNYFKGNIADYRIVKGSAVYTSNFSPPSIKLTAISGTSFLANRTNRYSKDESTNNLTIFVGGGTPRVVSETPYLKETYDPAIHGGSLFFDGTGDRLQIGDGATTNPSWSSWLNAGGSKTGTIEVWVYPRNHATSSTPYMHRSFWNKGNTFMNLGVRETGKFRFYWYDGTRQNWIDSNETVKLNEWSHLAAVLNGSSVTLYVNGINSGMTRHTDLNSGAQVATNGAYNGITDNSSYAGGEFFHIGGGPDSVEAQNFWNGFISNLRFVPGTQVYTGSFTPPTSPLTAISGTALLFKGENAKIIDQSGNTVIDTFGNAQISTSVVKYGSGSLVFDGSGDSLIIQSSPLRNIGTGDFTVEGWFRTTTWAAETMFRRLWASGTSTANDMSLNIFSDGKLQYRNNDTVLITASTVMDLNTWYHVAVVKSSGTTTIYLNGTSVGSTSTNNNLTTPNDNPMYVGNHPALIATWNGFIDDFRVTRFARYTSNFTAPVREIEIQ
jgi:hypothetical protein